VATGEKVSKVLDLSILFMNGGRERVASGRLHSFLDSIAHDFIPGVDFRFGGEYSPALFSLEE
jgi:hypothetical protein